MGTNSNRSRTRCAHDGCNELTRSNSGLCRLHMQTPAEAVIIRTERPLRDDYNRGPLRWEGGAVYRDRLGQTATLPAETATPTNDRTETDNASHSASGEMSRRHALSGPATPLFPFTGFRDKIAAGERDADVAAYRLGEHGADNPWPWSDLPEAGKANWRARYAASLSRLPPVAPSPSAPVLREVDAVGCDSVEVSRCAETTADFLIIVTLLAIVAGIGIAAHFLMSGGQ